MNDPTLHAPTAPQWRPSWRARVMAGIAAPVFRVVNRPALAWLGRALYDVALRCNGLAVGFTGPHGLAVGKERFLAKWFAGRPAGVLLDVGAHNGAYTNALRHVSPAAQIYAFEPHPRTFGKLQQRTAAGSTLTLIELAVSDLAGPANLYDYAADDGSADASLSEETIRLFTTDIVTHPVTATTIDRFMAERRIERVELLKIDTAGYELEVLRGAGAALAARAIAAVQFEFIPANIARHITMRDMFAALQGYRLYRLCVNGGLLPLDPYDVKRCEIYVTQSLVALPP